MRGEEYLNSKGITDFVDETQNHYCSELMEQYALDFGTLLFATQAGLDVEKAKGFTENFMNWYKTKHGSQTNPKKTEG
jgi:hypothetical protein